MESKRDNESMYVEAWDNVYKVPDNPFDIAGPYEWIVDLEDRDEIYGTVLDAGCGAGHNALYLAAKGHAVVGIDVSAIAIKRAKEKAQEKEVKNVTFLRADICKLSGLDNQFDTVIDIGCFHSLDGDDPSRYVEALRTSCKAGARVYLRAFSDSNPKSEKFVGRGPRCSETQIRTAFLYGWETNRLDERQIALALPGKEIQSYAWFGEIQKL